MGHFRWEEPHNKKIHHYKGEYANGSKKWLEGSGMATVCGCLLLCLLTLLPPPPSLLRFVDPLWFLVQKYCCFVDLPSRSIRSTSACCRCLIPLPSSSKHSFFPQQHFAPSTPKPIMQRRRPKRAREGEKFREQLGKKKTKKEGNRRLPLCGGWGRGGVQRE